MVSRLEQALARMLELSWTQSGRLRFNDETGYSVDGNFEQERCFFDEKVFSES